MAPDSSAKVLKMLKVLFLFLLLTAGALSQDLEENPDLEEDQYPEGSADLSDDEDLTNEHRELKNNAAPGNFGEAKGDDGKDSSLTVIIGVAVCAGLLAVAATVAFLLVRHHRASQQQGMYAAPAEQSLKGAI